MNKFFLQYVLFPAIEFYHQRDSIATIKYLERVQWYNSRQIEELQFIKLHKLLSHAYNEIPHYRERFKEKKVRPDDFKKIDDLKKFPFLTKEDVRLKSQKMSTPASRRLCRKIFTSGSTGIPLTIHLDRRRQCYDFACISRFFKWWGFDIGDKQAIIWGWPNEFIVPAIKKALFSRIFMSAFEMSEDTMFSFYQRLVRFQPKMIFGYATSIYAFAKFLKYKKLDAMKIHAKVIVVTGDVLYDSIRDYLALVFGCPVANHYGSRDGGIISSECPQGSMHVHAEGVLLEEVDSEIVVTNLEHYSMPFIRYRIGDRGKVLNEPCSCKRGLPILQSLKGRVNDVLITPSGKYIHGLSVAYTIKDFSGIRQFKVIQEANDKLLIKIKKEKSFSDGDIKIMRDRLQVVMGNDVEIVFDFVKELPQDDPRKLRYVVSKVTQNNN